MTEGRADVLLVATPGGHLLQLLALREAWSGLDRVWITGGTSDARSFLDGERVVIAHGPAHRSVVKLVANLVLAWRVISATRPRVLLSTGAAIAVPVAWVARLRGVRVIHVESLTRVNGPSLSGRLIALAAHEVYVQWPELQPALRGARYAGAVLAAR